MDKKERQRIDASIPKCRCGNNLSRDRVSQGLTLCPSCERPSLEERIDMLEERIARLEEEGNGKWKN